jgi:hypothetical protein
MFCSNFNLRTLVGLALYASFSFFQPTTSYACDCMCVTGDQRVVARNNVKNRAECIMYCEYASAARHQIVDARGACMSAGGPPTRGGGGGGGDSRFIERIDFNGGCLAVWVDAIYFSAGCQTLNGAGNGKAAYRGKWSDIVAIRIFNGCVMTALRAAIYKSCDGLNLTGGGNTKEVYPGAQIFTIEVTPQGLRTYFKPHGDCYLDPTGDHPGGGPGVTHCPSAG